MYFSVLNMFYIDFLSFKLPLGESTYFITSLGGSRAKLGIDFLYPDINSVRSQLSPSESPVPSLVEHGCKCHFLLINVNKPSLSTISARLNANFTSCLLAYTKSGTSRRFSSCNKVLSCSHAIEI